MGNPLDWKSQSEVAWKELARSTRTHAMQAWGGSVFCGTRSHARSKEQVLGGAVGFVGGLQMIKKGLTAGRRWSRNGPNSEDRKSLSIAKNHPKPSQEFSERLGSSIHKFKGCSGNSHQKVHPNFTQNLGRQILGKTLSGLKIIRFRRVRFQTPKSVSLLALAEFQG